MKIQPSSKRTHTHTLTYNDTTLSFYILARTLMIFKKNFYIYFSIQITKDDFPSIKTGYLNIPVEPFIPNPLRCQRFGNGQKTCRDKRI